MGTHHTHHNAHYSCIITSKVTPVHCTIQHYSTPRTASLHYYATVVHCTALHHCINCSTTPLLHKPLRCSAPLHDTAPLRQGTPRHHTLHHSIARHNTAQRCTAYFTACTAPLHHCINRSTALLHYTTLLHGTTHDTTPLHYTIAQHCGALHCTALLHCMYCSTTPLHKPLHCSAP
jgi:hypothetical protein